MLAGYLSGCQSLFLELDNANFIQKAAEVLPEERFELVEASVEGAVDHGRSIKHVLEVEPAIRPGSLGLGRPAVSEYAGGDPEGFRPGRDWTASLGISV